MTLIVTLCHSRSMSRGKARTGTGSLKHQVVVFPGIYTDTFDIVRLGCRGRDKCFTFTNTETWNKSQFQSQKLMSIQHSNNLVKKFFKRYI